MAKHQLQLDVPYTSNQSVFLIRDISIYTNLLPVNCPELQILPPGYGVPTVIDGLSPGFNLVLNACTLGIMSAASCADNCPNLPDGIYNVRYSLAPGDKVYVSYNVLRTTQAINRLEALYCNVGLKPCLPNQETVYDLQQLDLIRDYLIAAKTNVDQLNNPVDGVNLYKYAIQMMDKFRDCKPKCR